MTFIWWQLQNSNLSHKPVILTWKLLNKNFVQISQGNELGRWILSCYCGCSDHDGVVKWKYFRVTGHLCGHRSPVNSQHKGQWRAALMFSLNCAWIKGWVNTREAGDLRRHRAHYDVIVMIFYHKWGRGVAKNPMSDYNCQMMTLSHGNTFRVSPVDTKGR